MSRYRSLLFLAVVAASACARAESADVQLPADAEFMNRMSHEHVGDRPIASPAAREPLAEVITEEVTYATAEGRPVRGYLARPAEAAGDLPGIVVIHEWWGLNDNIRTMTRRLAGEGYVALAVDLLGETAESPERARELVTAANQSPEVATENLRQAIAYLRERGAARVGTIGWCFGGAWSLRAALAAGDQVDAAVVYYGQLVTDADALRPLRAPVLGIFGEEDRAPAVDQVRAFEAAMRSAGKAAEVHVYPEAGHGFANPSGQNYREAAAEDAWSRTTAFFARHLRG